jgi:HEPN domain-containing protein
MSDSIVENWLKLAEYDLTTAEAMYNTGRYLYVAFTCQQAIEKLLKARYVQKYDKTPPYTHNIVRLINELAFTSKLDEQWLEFADSLNTYYIESRYAEKIAEISDALESTAAHNILRKTREFFICLQRQQ